MSEGRPRSSAGCRAWRHHKDALEGTGAGPLSIGKDAKQKPTLKVKQGRKQVNCSKAVNPTVLHTNCADERPGAKLRAGRPPEADEQPQTA